MRATHVVINSEDVIAIIYQSEKLGKVVVFRTNKIDIESALEIHSLGNSGEDSKEDLLEMITEVLPQ